MSNRSESQATALLQKSQGLPAGRADVDRIRARIRRRRILRAALILGAIIGFFWFRYLTDNPIRLPHLGPDAMLWLPGVVLMLLFGAVILIPLVAAGRSPHVLIRPEHIDVGLSDVKGLDGQVQEVAHTLDVFMGYATFRERLGGNPRRGILFEGPPGTGKTYLAKAMAKQANVPFLFAASPAFQSMWYGMSAVKIRSFFKALRKAARREGGAIGFIEEIDAIGMSRGSLAMSPAPEGLAHSDARDPLGTRLLSRFTASGNNGMLNELLIQMQSFDQPPLRERMWGRVIEWLNGFLPPGRRMETGKPKYHNILVIAATNRADDLDAALLRPGRFDRRLYFDLPTKDGRRELIDFFLSRKSHHEQLDEDDVRDHLAHDTLGYTPVMIEHLFDESLLGALRDGRDRMNVSDVYDAKLTEEVGLKQAVVYTEAERRAIATHEAGHATVAFLVGDGRRLEVLSIIKRRQSLGLLAHGDTEERFTRSRSELAASLAISLGGLVAEEMFLGESGTGPAADLAAATQVAATMVGALGMGGSLVSYEAMHEGPINASNLVAKVLSNADTKDRVEGMLTGQKERVVALLEENRDLVEALRDALIERDELVGPQILDVLNRALAARPQPQPDAPLV